MTPTPKPTDPRSRVIIRGGGLYGTAPGYVRPAYPNRYLPGHRVTEFGFRTTQKLTRPITKVRF